MLDHSLARLTSHKLVFMVFTLSRFGHTLQLYQRGRLNVQDLTAVYRLDNR